MHVKSERDLVLDTLNRFLDDQYPPERVREIDRRDVFPREVVQDLGRLGLTGLTIPEEYGGAGRRIEDACLVTEALARRSTALAWAYVGCVFFGGENIARLASEGQRRCYLPGIAVGETVFAYALTEPNAGSDTSAVQCRARRTETGFVVDGTKVFISGASASDHILTLVRTGRGNRKRDGLSFLIVDRRSEGLSFRPIDKLGVHGSDTCEVVFDGVQVPAENLLGGEEFLDQGWAQLLRTLDVEHLHLAAEGVGLAQGAWDLTRSYLEDREQFGKRLKEFQVLQHRMADLATAIETARVYTYHVAQMADRGEECWKESAMAKLNATEVAKHVALECLQMFGGNGYMMEFDIQRYVRDSLVLTIGGGTSEILRNVIASAIFR